MNDTDNNKLNEKFTQRDMSGLLFYDAPGVPTLRGNIKIGDEITVNAEPAMDKNQISYTKITGDKLNGLLYKNDRKTKDNQPDFIGPIKFNGKELRVSAWIKQIKNGENAGNDFLSLSIQEPYKAKNDE